MSYRSVSPSESFSLPIDPESDDDNRRSMMVVGAAYLGGCPLVDRDDFGIPGVLADTVALFRTDPDHEEREILWAVATWDGIDGGFKDVAWFGEEREVAMLDFMERYEP